MKIIKTLFITLLILLIGLPYAIKYGLIGYLEHNYKVSVSLDDVQFNLITGEFGLQGMHIYGDDDQELHLGSLGIKLDLSQLIDYKVSTKAITIANLKTKITEDEQKWNIGGISFPISNSVKNESEHQIQNERSESSVVWQYGVDLIKLEQVDLSLNINQFEGDLLIEKLSINQLYSWQPETATLFELKTQVNKSPILLKGKIRPFMQSIDLNAAINVTQLEVAPLIMKLEDDINYQDINGIINMDIEVTFEQSLNSGQLLLSGQFSIDELFANDAIQLLSVKSGNIEWEGKVDVSIPTKDKSTQLMVQSVSRLSLKPLVIVSEEKNVLLLSLGQLMLNDFSIVDKVIRIKSIELEKIKTLEDLGDTQSRAPVMANKLNVENLTFADNQLSISNVLLSTLDVSIDVDVNGDLQRSLMMKKNTSDTDTEDEIEVTVGVAKDDKLDFKIDKLIITDNSRLAFSDRSITPSFEVSLNNFEFMIDDVNSKTADSWSNINLNSVMNDFGRIKIEGKIKPFSEKVNTELTANLKDITLVPFSSYSGKYADLFIKQGSVNADVKIRIINDSLNIKNKIRFSQLKLEPGNSEVSKKWLIELPMPLDITLNALRDKKNEIALDIPIEGNVTDPDFHLEDVYNTAMINAIKVAATYYITQAIQPLGLVITAGKLVGKALKPSFEPLIFEAGLKIITLENKRHLRKIQKLFIERPGLTLVVCAVSVENDWRVIMQKAELGKKAKAANLRTNKLLKLAGDRSRAVKRFLVDDNKISPSRIFACNGKIDNNEKARPRVKLSL